MKSEMDQIKKYNNKKRDESRNSQSLYYSTKEQTKNHGYLITRALDG